MDSKKALETVDGLLGSCETPRERRELLGDLFTDSELVDLAERWEIVRRLLDGVPQRTIQSQVGVSISLVTRASNALKAGGKGFRRAYDRASSRKPNKNT